MPNKLSANLTISPTSIAADQSAMLKWTSNNATSATLDGVAVTPNGSQSVNPTATHTYQFIASNAAGRLIRYAKLTVASAALPSGTFTASANTVNAGQSVTLSWTSSNATSVTLDGSPVARSGNQSVSPTASTVYTLTLTGTGGSKTLTQSVVVNGVVDVFPPEPSDLGSYVIVNGVLEPCRARTRIPIRICQL